MGWMDIGKVALKYGGDAAGHAGTAATLLGQPGIGAALKGVDLASDLATGEASGEDVGKAAIQAGLQYGASKIVGHLVGESDEQKLRTRMLEQQVEATDRLERIGRGEFTDVEAKGFTSSVRSAMGESLAARGLARSPMATGAISRASAERLRQVQLQASQLSLGGRDSLLSRLKTDDTVFDDLASISQNIAKLSPGGDNATNSDPYADITLDQINQLNYLDSLIRELKDGTPGQGYEEPANETLSANDLSDDWVNERWGSMGRNIRGRGHDIPHTGLLDDTPYRRESVMPNVWEQH